MQTFKGTSAEPPVRRRSAFTLIELLVVIAIIVILAAILLPTLGRAKQRAIAVHCMGNLRQLQFGWHMYAGDNQDYLAGNHWRSQAAHTQADNWITGWLDPRRINYPDNTNTLYLMDQQWASLGPYMKSVGVYRCMASKVTCQEYGATYPVVRTVAINVWMGYINDPDPANVAAGYKNIRRLGDLQKMSPSNAYVFIDERDDSIDDGSFGMDYLNDWIVNYPASYHVNSGGLSFADGHAEIHKWRTPEFQPRQQFGQQITKAEFMPVSGNNVDLVWLRQHATYRE